MAISDVIKTDRIDRQALIDHLSYLARRYSMSRDSAVAAAIAWPKRGEEHERTAANWVEKLTEVNAIIAGLKSGMEVTNA